MKSNLIIVGNSTTAETIYNFVKTYNLFNIIGFAVHKKYHKSSKYLGEKNYILEELDVNGDFYLFVAMQWNRLNRDRRDVYEDLKSLGFKFANIISPTAIVHGEILGDNCWIADRAILQFGTVIGANSFIKAGVSLGPRTKIGSHCFIGLHTAIGGASVVGNQSFIGINSTIFDEVIIGDCCLIGACSVVKRNLSSYSKVTSTHIVIEVKQYESDSAIECKLLSNKNIR